MPFFHTLVTIEPIALFLCLVFFLRAGLSRRYPAIRNYLIFRAASTAYLLTILDSHFFISLSPNTLRYWYFYSYWICYLVAAVLIVNVIREAFNKAMNQKPLVRRIADMMFRWALYFGALTFAALSIEAIISPTKSFPQELCYMAKTTLFTVFIFEMGMMGFLAFSVKNFGGKLRNPAIAMMLGFGTMASAQWILLLIEYYAGKGIWNSDNYILQCLTDGIMITWALYFRFASVEDERDEAYQALVDTPLLRWAAVANKYAQRPRESTSVPNTSFFLQQGSHPHGSRTRAHP